MEKSGEFLGNKIADTVIKSKDDKIQKQEQYSHANAQSIRI